MTPRKVGDVYIYNQPNKSINDYDVPPSRYFPNESMSEGDSLDSQGNYNHSLLSKSKVDNSSTMLYDTPPARALSVRHSPDNIYSVPLPRTDTYDTPRSNRSSMISTMSADSTMTLSSSASTPSLARSSNPPSMCDSARSSLDVSPQDLYDVPPSGTRAVKQTSTDSGLDTCMYDSPGKPKAVPGSEVYDSPRSNIYAEPASHTYDTITKNKKEHSVDDIYDVPTNNAPRIVLEAASSERDDGTLKFTGRKINSGVYAIPPQVTRDSVLSIKSDSSDEGQRLSTCSVSSRDSDVPFFSYDELPLDLDSAMDLLVKLQQDVQKSTTKMNSFVSSTWRKREKLEPRLYDIKLACGDVKASLEAFVSFAQGALANSMRAADKNLIKKLHRQLSPLQHSLQQIQKCYKNLEDYKWAVTKLAVESGATKDDDLSTIASQSKDLNSDVRKLASFIQGNSTLLFKRAHDLNQSCSSNTPESKKSSTKPALKPKPDVGPKPQIPAKGQSGNVQQRPLPAPPPRDRPLPPTPPQKSNKKSDIVVKRISTGSKDNLLANNHYENDAKDWVDDYDYVHLEAKEALARQRLQCPSKDSPSKTNEEDLSPKQLAKMEKLEEDLKTPVNTDMSQFILPEQNSLSSKLELNDQQLLGFYIKQLDVHAQLLTNAIDAFFGCIEYNQPPRVFIAHSKFVVLAAHKIVYIGDTLHRNLLNSDIRSKIMHCANFLCDCLKLTVTATKTAALQYPSVQAVQEMVDRVVDVSHAGHELKLVIVQASTL